MRLINEIVVHCTATPEGRPVSVAEIRRWHRARGWKDIGYHFVVHLDGRVEAGRPVAEVGAHVAGRNANTIGVVYVGGVDANNKPKDTRTAQQWLALADLLRKLLDQHPTITHISGHRDYANKACPSFDAAEEYAPLVKRKLSPKPKPLKAGAIDEADGAERSLWGLLPILRPIGQAMTGLGISGASLLATDWKTVAVIGGFVVVGIAVWAVADQMRRRA